MAQRGDPKCEAFENLDFSVEITIQENTTKENMSPQM